MLKEFLSHHNIDFQAFNVAEDAQARDEMIDKYNSMSTPTIVIGDEVMTGFDPDKLSKIFNLE
ncbi:glutaredoxin domain-containing protein [Alkalihalobacillus sp. AL-G]|uniref:glutaredoxin domain-containing protein n=1 Tax=Alkalihalobacillus sp. AL-G TaxID=2926399 RepID=UPI00272BC8E4|nr:glutaredoxin domain-containing protein [Alkalihalobacillus sp. AL-G]WLD91543.1 glutaredoxin family protein [Alkalihalobacillus sp. AL-G]